MICKKCGNELKNDDEFCNKCGTRVNSNGTKNKRNIIIVICILIILGATGYFIINKDNINLPFFASKKYENEIETIKPLLIDKINLHTSQKYNEANNYYKLTRLDTSKYRTNNLTEGILEAEFKENYKGKNIYYFTTKGQNDFSLVTCVTYGTRDGVVKIESTTYEGLYVYMENSDVHYNPDLTKLKEDIDMK